MQKMHRLPRQVQVLELKKETGGRRGAAPRSRSVYYDEPAKIQTSDGFFVDVDVTILYKIIDPYKVVKELGPGQQYLHQGILPKAVPFLKQALGELTTEEFYNSPLRVEKADLARDLLDVELQPLGLQVDHILVRYFEYTQSIQDNIEAKKLQDQLVFTNQSKRKAAQEEQSLNRVEKEGQMNVTITMQEGEAYRIRKEADRDLYVRTKKAEADLLVQLANATSEELRNEAMQVLGADRLVAMTMAEVLRGLDVIILPSGGAGNLNPLNLDSVLEMFGVRNYTADQPAAPPPQTRIDPGPAGPGPNAAETEVETEAEVVQ